MNNLLGQVILNNTLGDWLWTIGVILFVIILAKFISRYLARLLCSLFRRQWKIFDQQTFIELVIYPLSIFLIVTVSIITLYRLNFPAVLNLIIYKFSLQRIFHTVAAIIQVVTFIWLLLRIIDFIASVLERKANATPDQGDNQLIVFFKDFVKVILAIIGFLLTLHFAFDYHIGSLLTGLSIVGAAIALSLRESLENLIASFVIFFDKPFTTGDMVKVQNITGHVERIGLRSTRIRTLDKSYVTVPNKQMVDSILDNISQRSQLRGELILQVNLQTSTAKVESLIQEIKTYLEKVDEISSFTVIFNDIRIQAFMVSVEFFTMPMELSHFIRIREELNLFVLKAMEQLEIRMGAEGKDFAIII